LLQTAAALERRGAASQDQARGQALLLDDPDLATSLIGPAEIKLSNALADHRDSLVSLSHNLSGMVSMTYCGGDALLASLDPVGTTVSASERIALCSHAAPPCQCRTA
jgi:hypothetical protein